jgi:hypothetical protein
MRTTVVQPGLVMHRDEHEWLEGHRGKEVSGLMRRDQRKGCRKLRRKYIIARWIQTYLALYYY